MLGGLLGTQEIRTKSGIPGLMDIPGLGYLFGSEKLERSRGEIFVVLVPHIVRAPDYTPTNLRGVAAGNDQNVKLNYAPRDVQPAAPGNVPAPATPPEAKPVPEAAAPAPAPPSPAPATGAAQLTFAPSTVQAAVNTPVALMLQMTGAQDLFSAPMKIRFDPKVLQLQSIRPGGLMSADGQQPNFTESIANEIGEATITLNRLPGSSGVSGSGVLLQLTFQAVAPGVATVSVTDAALKNMQLQPVAAGAPSANVAVTP
jgi:general secretion pathway protein D